MRFYVYALIDPRDNQQFYIGKGQRQRAWKHEQDAKKGEPGLRFNRIREILSVGYSPKIEILKRFDDEIEAYKYEAILIKQNRKSLLNIAHGGIGAMSRDKPYKAPLSLDKAVARTMGLILKLTQNFTCPHPHIRLPGGGILRGDHPLLADGPKEQVSRLIETYGKSWFENESGYVFQ